MVVLIFAQCFVVCNFNNIQWKRRIFQSAAPSGITKKLHFISFISNYFRQSSVKSNKQSARSNSRLPKGKVIASDLTTMPGDKYFMKSHKQIKDESQTEKKKRKITFAKPKKEKRDWWRLRAEIKGGDQIWPLNRARTCTLALEHLCQNICTAEGMWNVGWISIAKWSRGLSIPEEGSRVMCLLYGKSHKKYRQL